MESVTPQQSPPRVHYQPERDRWACWTGRRPGAAVREQLQGGKTRRLLSPAGGWGWGGLERQARAAVCGWFEDTAFR